MHSSNYCPRCGSDRLLRPSARAILVICLNCGLMSNEPELPPLLGTTNTETGLELMLRSHGWRLELPACGRYVAQMKHP